MPSNCNYRQTIYTLNQTQLMRKFLVADDHSAIRKGVKLILTDEYRDVEFGEAENADEVFQKVKEKEWDLLILDINMPGKNGLVILKQLKDEKINIPVLVFSMHTDHQFVTSALELGAAGYLSKDNADTDLITAINQILS